MVTIGSGNDRDDYPFCLEPNTESEDTHAAATDTANLALNLRTPPQVPGMPRLGTCRTLSRANGGKEDI